MAQIFVSGMTPIEVWSVINEIAPFDWKYIDVYIDNSIIAFVSSNMVTRVCDALEETFCITQEKEYEDAIEVEFWRRACCENINNGRRYLIFMYV